MSWSGSLLELIGLPEGVDVCIVADDAKLHARSYTKESLRLRGPRVVRGSRSRRLLVAARERNKTKYPSSRWQSDPETQSSQSDASVYSKPLGRPHHQRRMSFDSQLQMPRRRGDTTENSVASSLKMPVRQDSFVSLKMPVRQESFVLRPALSTVRLQHSSSYAANTMDSRMTVDIISKVLADLDLIEQEESRQERDMTACGHN